MKWIELLQQYAGEIVAFFMAFIVNMLKYMFEVDKIVISKWVLNCIISGLCAATMYHASPEWIPKDAKFFVSIIIGFIGGFKILKYIETFLDKKVDDRMK